MAFLSKEEVEHEIAQAVGLQNSQVAKVFNKLINLACQEIEDGFLLPEIGELRVVQEEGQKGTNPFTGEPVYFKGPLKVQLTVDSNAEERLLGKKDGPVREKRHVAEDKPPLPEIRLTLNGEDWRRNGQSPIKLDETYNKIGGVPMWIQADETPTCCGVSTRFCGQLDLAHIGGPEMLYVFFCDQCFSPSTVYQCS